jgi:hypothetical protein
MTRILASIPALLLPLLLASPALAIGAAAVGFGGQLFDSAKSCCGYSFDGSLTFTLWDAAEAGAGKSSFSVSLPVKTDTGFFHVELELPLAEISQAAPRWIAVSNPAGAGELKPRVLVSAVPKALVCTQAGYAADAGMLGGKEAATWTADLGKKADASAVLTKEETAKAIADALDKAKQDLIAEIAKKADASGVYAKAEVDKAIGDAVTKAKTELGAEIAAKADKTGVHTKAEVDALIVQATAALKGEVETKLGLKADKATTYSKTEVDAKIKALEDGITAQSKLIADQGKLIADLGTKVTTCEAKLAVSGTCPADMRKVGDFCVDRYEASLWVAKDGGVADCAAVQKAIDEILPKLDKGWTAADIYKGFDSGHPDCKLTAGGSPGGGAAPTGRGGAGSAGGLAGSSAP